MDPISAIASITGILTAAVQITSVASSLISRWKEAPEAVHGIVVEMTALGACLAQLKPYLEDLDKVSSARTKIISPEHIMVILSACVLSISELQKSLDIFDIGKKLTLSNKLWWSSHEKKIKNLRSRVQASTGSLNLILTAITCSTVEESRQSIRRLEEGLEHILETDTDLSSRFRGPYLHDTSSRYPSSTHESVLDTSDDASVITVKRLIPSQESVPRNTVQPTFGLDPDTEHRLFNSAVYLRTARRHSLSSLPTTSITGPNCEWSFCSFFSLAQISSISVLSLPISSWELWKPDQYATPSENNLLNSSIQPKSPSLGGSMVDDVATYRRSTTSYLSPIIPPVSFDSILEDSFMGSQTFVNICKTYDLSVDDLEELLDTNVWVDQLFWWKNNSHRHSLNYKVLLFDAAVPGQSTLLKQMLMLYRKDHTYIDLLLHRTDIICNLLGTFKCLIMIRQVRGFFYVGVDSWEHEKTIVEASLATEGVLPPYLCAAMKEIWKEECIGRALCLLDGFPLRNDFESIVEDIDRIASPHYLPTTNDMRCTYSVTPGVNECFFSLKPFQRAVGLHFLDVSDNESFATVSWARTLLFVVPWTGDLADGVATEQLDKTYSLFESVLKLPRFKSSKLILIINKLDSPDSSPNPMRLNSNTRIWVTKFEDVASAAKRKVTIRFIDLSSREDIDVKLKAIFNIGDYDPNYGFEWS